MSSPTPGHPKPCYQPRLGLTSEAQAKITKVQAAALNRRPPGVTIVELEDLDEAFPIAGQDIAGTDDVAWARIPEALRVALVRYIEHRISPGGFLRALLEGDEVLALAYATTVSHAAMPALTYWLETYAPTGSYGDADKVTAWLRGARKSADDRG